MSSTRRTQKSFGVTRRANAPLQGHQQGDTGMERFEVIEIGTKFKIRDTANGKYVAYSYSFPPMYEGESRCKYSEWSNPLSARGFARKMEKINTAR